jgi:hypothetical protein
MSVLQWLKDKPVYVWLVVSGLLSLAYTKLESYPRTQAVLSFLAGFGLDLPTIQAAVKKAIGAKKKPPSDGPYRTGAPPAPPPVPPSPPSPQARADLFAAIGVAALFGSIMLAPASCLSPAQQVQVATDVASIAACVIAHENEPPAQIAATCGLAGAQDVINLLAKMDQRAAAKYPQCLGTKDAGADR